MNACTTDLEKKRLKKHINLYVRPRLLGVKKAFTVKLKLLTVKLSKEPENENDEGKPLPRKKIHGYISLFILKT